MKKPELIIRRLDVDGGDASFILELEVKGCKGATVRVIFTAAPDAKRN